MTPTLREGDIVAFTADRPLFRSRPPGMVSRPGDDEEPLIGIVLDLDAPPGTLPIYKVAFTNNTTTWVEGSWLTLVHSPVVSR